MYLLSVRKRHVHVLTSSGIIRLQKVISSGYVASATRVFTLARDSMWSSSAVAVT